jgi:hypothetical protein
MPYRVVKYQATPNPNAIKVMLDKPITDRPRSCRSPAGSEGVPRADRFFAIDGVAGLLFNGDWFTVNKAPAAEWAAIKKQIERELADLADA